MNMIDFSTLTLQSSRLSSWRFEISALLPLLGGEQELEFRLVRRRPLDLLTLAPITGFTTYFSEHNVITDALGQTYFSPFGCKIAPLRNMRLKKLITSRGLLAHGSVRRYKVGPRPKFSTLSRWMEHKFAQSNPTLILTVSSWSAVLSLMVFSATYANTTWIGFANVLVLCVWSITMRLVDRFTLEPVKHEPAEPEGKDAAVFLGSRNSALILEGTRADVARWTGVSLQLRQGPWIPWIIRLSQAGTLCMLGFILLTIPNGTGQDQLLFMAINLLGQVNTWLGQWLHTEQTLRGLSLVSSQDTRTRTDVFGELLWTFGKGRWVNSVGILPTSRTWEIWLEKVHDGGEKTTNAKKLWDDLYQKASSMESDTSESPLQISTYRRSDFGRGKSMSNLDEKPSNLVIT